MSTLDFLSPRHLSDLRRSGLSNETIERVGLRTIDVSTRPGGRPRWRITPEALAEFEERRSARPAAKTRRRRTAAEPVHEYV